MVCVARGGPREILRLAQRSLRMMGWTPARFYTTSQWAKNVRDIRSEAQDHRRKER
jgi:hypothetical protein